MSGPSVYLTLPPLSLFKFPPDNAPPTLPPPSDERTFKSPFAIDPKIYNGALRAEVPLAIAGTYIVAVTILNAYNRSKGNKPWWISKTRAFKAFVVLHNVFLAVYSAVTFAAMFRAISHTWPGLDQGTGLAGVADALCKIHGPRGLGDAVTFNASTSVWEVKNKLIQLAPEGTPDPTDVGRLWGEGLAFWGWFFYLSKFYEVVDTLIIVSKGKRSATLQTYHHAGAMMCMWAGIRYMSTPIWMFVFLNSAIHTLMYTYFTLSAVNVRVPLWIKRTLTTLQISQFLFGASYAAIHLFVEYDIPVQTVYTILHPIASLASAATSTVSELASSATDAAASPVASYGALLRRLLLRAAGDEGVAENVRDSRGQIVMPGVQEAIQRYHEETRYRTDYHKIHCVDTTGQSFAIWLNIVYLAPLTALFVRFFIRAYTYRTSSATPKQSKRHAAGRSSVDAAKGVNREVDDLGKSAERTLSDSIENIDEAIRKDLKQVKEGKYGKHARRVSDRVESFERKVKSQAETARDKVSDVLTPERKSVSKAEGADSLDELKKNVKKEPGSAKEEPKVKEEETEPKTPEAASSYSDTAHSKDSTSSLKAEAEDDAEEESKTENEQSTPSKKKRKHKKKKNHSTEGAGDAEAGEKDLGSSSIVDVAAEQAKEKAEQAEEKAEQAKQKAEQAKEKAGAEKKG